jgi:4-amino-4-deoxy-L-arabinose transferase-like glycosyltransferase
MRLLKTYNIFWIVILICLLFLSIFYAYISADAPYYLAISRDISNGFVPYKDIISLYAPLMMYMNSLLYLFIEAPGYHYFLIFQYFVIFISTGILFLIGKKLDLNNRASIFLGLFLFIAVLSSDGIYINLEVYILLCVLLSFWFLINKQFFWTGIFLALSFFSKQYGILNFLPFFLLVGFYHGFDKKYLINFVIGSALPLLAFLVYFLLIENVSFMNLIEQLSGKGYGQRGVSSTKSIFSLIVGFKVFLLLIFPLLFLRINPFKNKIDGILIIGILVNLIPVLIKNFPHYFILTYPYIFILMARNYKNFDKRFLLVSNLMLIIISVLLFIRIFRYKDVYEEQLRVAEKYKNEYPVSSEVFLSGKIRYLYILNNYHNPVLKEVGYAYDFFPDEDFRKKYPVLSLE